MADKYVYDENELKKMDVKELDKLLNEHGYDLNDFVDKEFRIEVLSNLVEC